MFTRPTLAHLAPNWMNGDVTITFDGAALQASSGTIFPAVTCSAATTGRPVFDHALWLRLKGMALDEPGAELTFASRLARDNGWTDDFANGVIEEYLRFLYLAARCGHPVTPSDEVDQAWHLHMLYSRHYWRVLCGEVLGFRLEHGPTRGGETEAAKYRNWYENTLASYERYFGETPAADIWPKPDDRFDPARTCVRVPARRTTATAYFPRRAFLLLAVLAAASAAFGNSVFKQGTVAPLMLFGALAMLVVYIIADASANAGPRKEGEKCGSAGGCGGCGGGGCGGCGGCGG